MKKLIVLTSLIVILSSVILTTSAHAANFSGLGDLPGGGFKSIVRGISPDGSIVVGNSTSASGNEAFRWTLDSGMVGLGDLEGGGFNSTAYDVSNTGSVIVGFGTTESGTQACCWTSSGHKVTIGSPGSNGLAVSADGSTIAGYQNGGSNTQSAVWKSSDWSTPGSITDVYIGMLPGYTYSHTRGISADGSIVVGYNGYALAPTQGFRWTLNEGISGLGFVRETIFSSASGISADGSTIVGSSDWEAIRWTSDTGMVSLGIPALGYYGSCAIDVSADGSIIVGLLGEVGSPSNNEAFIWDKDNGMRVLKNWLISTGLDMTGWTLEDAMGISDDGKKIVGNGINPNGKKEGWIITLCDYKLTGDLDDNCRVNLADFALMAANWMIDCYANPSDPACIAK